MWYVVGMCNIPYSRLPSHYAVLCMLSASLLTHGLQSACLLACLGTFTTLSGRASACSSGILQYNIWKLKLAGVAWQAA